MIFKFDFFLHFQDSLFPDENEGNNKKRLDDRKEEVGAGENNIFSFQENRGRNVQVITDFNNELVRYSNGRISSIS